MVDKNRRFVFVKTCREHDLWKPTTAFWRRYNAWACCNTLIRAIFKLKLRSKQANYWVVAFLVAFIICTAFVGLQTVPEWELFYQTLHRLSDSLRMSWVAGAGMARALHARHWATCPQFAAAMPEKLLHNNLKSGLNWAISAECK